MRVSSLSHHLVDLHEIYQQQVVAEELLDEREGVVYRVGEGCAGKLCCPFPRCSGKLASGWMIRQHSGMYIPWTMTSSRRKGGTRVVRGVGCKSIPSTLHTSIQRSARPGRRGGTSKILLYGQHLLYGSNSSWMGTCWRRSMCFDTSAACSCRTMMMSSSCKASYTWLVGCGQELARCCVRRLRRHELMRNSTRLSCNLSSCTAARCGF